MLPFVKRFWQDDEGQDLMEYTLLMAFVALASASIYLGAGSSLAGIWSGASSQMVAANSAS